MNVRVQLKFAQWILLAVAVGIAGCGLDNLGVRSVEFTLQPALGHLPDDYDRLGAMMATGHVEVDVIEGHGTLRSTGLPVPPAGFDYMATLMFAHGERQGLPGDDTMDAEPAGHAVHGALTSADSQDESHDGGGGLQNLPLGVFVVADGTGGHDFTTDDIGDHVLGGLRAAMIMLMPIGMGGGMHSMGHMILFGEVGQDPDSAEGSEPAGEGGHAHGA